MTADERTDLEQLRWLYEEKRRMPACDWHLVDEEIAVVRERLAQYQAQRDRRGKGK